MSYDQFPDEFEILKGSLENEDFERAESVLLMILKKQSDHPQAKLDLEKVRGKLGSISNYEFRVRAFLDQDEPDTAKKIMEEALTKFKKNKRIMKLAEFFKKADAKAQEEAKQEAESSGSSELPNLSDTFTESSASKEEMSKVREILGGGVTGKGAAPGAGVPGAATGPLPGGQLLGRKPGEAPKDKGASKPSGPAAPKFGAAGVPTVGVPSPAPATAGAPAPAAGGKDQPPPKLSPEMEALHARNRRLTVAQKFDLMMLGLVGLVVLIAVGMTLAVLGANMSAGMPPQKIEANAIQKHKSDLDEFPKWTAERKEKYLRQLIEAKGFTLAEVEALYAEFIKKANTDPVVQQYADRLYRWRLDTRRSQPTPLRAPIEPAELANAEWNVDKYPPQYGLAPLITTETVQLGIGLAVALIPGVLLGFALAYCRLPGLNRVFQFVWELWYAMPIVALLYLGVASLASKLGVKSASTLGAVVLGLAMVPHVAFYARQGFTNIIGKSFGKSIGLGVMSAISGALGAAARFLGEGAVIVGVAYLMGQKDAEWAQPVATAGREILMGLQSLVASAGGQLMPATDSAAEIRWAIAQYLGFWLMLTAVVLALISQALQVAIAVEGMKGVMPDDSETPDAPQQGMLSPLSLAGFVAGLVILAVGAGLLLLSHLGAQAVNQNSNWGGVLDANKVGDITGSTISLGLLSGVIAFVVGGGFALVPALFISGRRIRAVAESLLRIPTALPPAMLVIALVEVGLSPGAMSARIALILALAPLAAVMVFQTLEAYRRGPYVKDKQNRLPQPSLLNTARALDLVGTLLFIIAVAMGAYTIVFVFGGNVAGTGSADTKVPTLGSYLMYALTSTQHGVSSGPAWNYYLSHVTLVVAFTLLAFICRLLAEGAGRLAVIKRG